MRTAISIISAILSISAFIMSTIMLFFYDSIFWFVLFLIGLLMALMTMLIKTYDDYEDTMDYDYAYTETIDETESEDAEEKKSYVVKFDTKCPHCGAPMVSDTCGYCGCKSAIYKVIQ